MFTSRLPDADYRIVFSVYAERHFLKGFTKKYPGKQWQVTQQSIFDSLRRIHTIQQTQQADELKAGPECILFKYDFAVAKTNVSAKTSGNRCIVFLDCKSLQGTVLLIYGKTDLPKNQSETQFIMRTVENEFSELWKKLNTATVG